MPRCPNLKRATTEVTSMNKTESHLSILRGLLNYHERMMSFRECPAGECEKTECTDGKCPNTVFIDTYAEALREAIRCVEIVNEVNQ